MQKHAANLAELHKVENNQLKTQLIAASGERPDYADENSRRSMSRAMVIHIGTPDTPCPPCPKMMEGADIARLKEILVDERFKGSVRGVLVKIGMLNASENMNYHSVPNIISVDATKQVKRFEYSSGGRSITVFITPRLVKKFNLQFETPGNDITNKKLAEFTVYADDNMQAVYIHKKVLNVETECVVMYNQYDRLSMSFVPKVFSGGVKTSVNSNVDLDSLDAGDFDTKLLSVMRKKMFPNVRFIRDNENIHYSHYIKDIAALHWIFAFLRSTITVLEFIKGEIRENSDWNSENKKTELSILDKVNEIYNPKIANGTFATQDVDYLFLSIAAAAKWATFSFEGLCQKLNRTELQKYNPDVLRTQTSDINGITEFGSRLALWEYWHVKNQVKITKPRKFNQVDPDNVGKKRQAATLTVALRRTKKWGGGLRQPVVEIFLSVYFRKFIDVWGSIFTEIPAVFKTYNNALAFPAVKRKYPGESPKLYHISVALYYSHGYPLQSQTFTLVCIL